MKKVARDELLPLGAYEQIRERFRARVIAEKKERRLHPAPEISVLFENHDTALFQIQEMLRTERITSEAAIQHELDTYNELVPDSGELSATLFVEIADKAERDRRLAELAGLERSISLEIAGSSFPAKSDARGDLTDRTTAVHYLKFSLGETGVVGLRAAAQAPGTGATFVIAHPKLALRAPLPESLLRALVLDHDG